MARLQILELPTGVDDDRLPFVLVVDQTMPQRVALGADAPFSDYWQDLADKIGARGVIVTPETVEIPANDTSAYLATPAGKQELVVNLNGDLDAERVLDMREARIEAQRLAHKRTDIAHDMERLADHKAAIADALGLDPLRNWDDIRNSAVRLWREREAQASELEQLRAGEEPGWDHRVVPTPGQWIARWNQSTAKERLSMAAQILDAMPRANDCFMADHEAQIAHLRAEVNRLCGEMAQPDA